MATHDTYRTNNGNYFFEFAFENVGDFYYAHILNQPSYQGREDGLYKTHRLSSEYTGASKRICFAHDTDAKTLNITRKYAEAWAEETVKYIENGSDFFGSAD